MQCLNENNVFDNTIIVIPSLEPTTALVAYTNRLMSQGFLQVVIVNDGSSRKYNFIFEDLRKIRGCTVLTHEKNRGKGTALKTGYQYIKQNFSECQSIITADADGQHSIEDVCKMAAELKKQKKCLLLGCRNFSLPSIPVKSRIGNRTSSVLFFLLYGKWIGDTQTGLRGFHTIYLDEMLQIKGERFEYEMEVIISCITKKIPMKQIEIQTIYEDNNESTHFQAFNDSVRIGKVIFKN